MSKEKLPPNVLVVICDDLGMGDLSSSGNSIVRTPVLDAFRAVGVDATRHLSGPLCTPARSALLTGLYAQRTRAIDTYCGRSLMDSALPTMADCFKTSGYRTGCFGKWHLGDTFPYRPQDRGFDEVLMHSSGGVGQPGDALGNAGRESYFDPLLSHNGEEKSYKGHVTEIFTSAAIDFTQSSSTQPWLAYLAYNAPHTPLQIDDAKAEACRKRGATGKLAPYYALVEDIDTQFGRLLEALESSGQRENTIIVFTSDHGPCPSVTDEAGQQRFNAGLRGQKGHVYEGGARVPTFWQWPAQWQASQIEVNTHVMDIFPTLADCCAVEAPEKVDGLSLQPVLEQAKVPEVFHQRPLAMQWHRGDRPVPYRNAALWQGDWKWVSVSEAGPDELYNLSRDSAEAKNLAEAEPERCQAMRKAYADWLSEVSAPHNYAPLPLVLGDPSEPMTPLSRQDWRVCGADGWSASDQGWWPIEVAKAGTYRIEVLFEQAPPERGSVVLKLNGEPHALEAMPGKTSYAFEIKLDKGSARLEGELQARFFEASPLLLRVIRKEMPS